MTLYQHQIRIRKEYLKFSAAHLTVFPDGSAERLHGHNYTTQLILELRDIAFEKMIPFAQVKKAIAEICGTWDEKVLLPTRNPFLKLSSPEPDEVEFLIGKKRYRIPLEDAVLLELDNITTETLSFEACRQLVQALSKTQTIELMTTLELRIEESPGQGSSCRWNGPSTLPEGSRA